MKGAELRYLDPGEARGASALEGARDRWLLMRLLAAARTAPLFADRLLGERDSLGAVLQLSDERLRQLGAGGDVVALLGIVREIVRAVCERGAAARPRIEGGADIAALLFADMAWRETEEVRVAFLDSARRLIRIERFGEGSIDCAAIYPREVARRALELSAAHAVLVHNHPSGDPTPSASDRAMTRRLAAALATLDIGLLDHVVIARSGWASAGISTVRISNGAACAGARKLAGYEPRGATLLAAPLNRRPAPFTGSGQPGGGGADNRPCGRHRHPHFAGSVARCKAEKS